MDSDNLMNRQSRENVSVPAPYEGAEEYVFISYAHKDKDMARKIISGLNQKGIRLWHDAGIMPGAEWFNCIAERIRNCSYAIIILTENYVQSEYCRLELNYICNCIAQQAVTPVIVQIGSFELPLTFELLIGRYQRLFYSWEETEQIVEQLNKFLFKEQRMQEFMERADQSRAVGDLDSAISCYTAMLEIVEEKEQPQIYLNLGNIYKTQGDFTRAIAYYEKSIEICQRKNLKISASILVSLYEQLGFLFAERSDFGKAQEYLNIAVDTAKSHQLTDRSDYYNSTIAEIRKRAESGTPSMSPDSEFYQKIADFQRSSAELMQEILKNDVTPDAYNCICTTLNRLINYCKIVGGIDGVITQCNSDLQKAEEVYSARKEAGKSYKAASQGVTAFRNLLGIEKPGAPDYDVFISYKSEDQKLAERICNRIRRNGKHVFLATDDLKEIGRSEYVEMIDDALNHSKHLIVVATDTDYLSTGWVKHEWQWFESRRRDGAKEGEILLVFDDRICDKKDDFPPTLMDKEIFPTSCYEERIFNYLW